MYLSKFLIFYQWKISDSRIEYCYLQIIFHQCEVHRINNITFIRTDKIIFITQTIGKKVRNIISISNSCRDIGCPIKSAINFCIKVKSDFPVKYIEFFIIERRSEFGKIQFQIVGQCPRGNYLLRDCKSRIIPCADCKSARTFDCLQTRQITIVH